MYTFIQCRKSKVMTCAPPLALDTDLSGEKGTGELREVKLIIDTIKLHYHSTYILFFQVKLDFTDKRKSSGKITNGSQPVLHR